MTCPSPKVSRLVLAMPPDSSVGTWFVIEALMGRDRAMSYGRKRARHSCEKAIGSAERCGYIRRLPSRVRSSSPWASGRFPRRVPKELAWTLTEDGIELRRILILAQDANQPRRTEGLDTTGAEELQ